MFQTARPNSRVYVFFKGNKPHLEQGYVTTQPVQRPKYQVPPTFGQPQEMVLDLTIRTDSGTYTFNGIPANIEVADTFCNGEAAIISDSREAMNAEILSIRQKSEDALNSRGFHENMISICNDALGVLNPEYAERQTRDEEFTKLKGQVESLSGKLDLLLERISPKD